MRVVRMRWDMAICFFLMVATVFGLIKLDEKIGFAEKAIDAISSMELPGDNTDVPDGEVGGYATEDLPILETEEELRECDGYFTMKMTPARLYNMGSVQGKKYSWRILKLDNDKLVAAKFNSDKIQEVKDGSLDMVILPTGKCVYEDSEAYAIMKEQHGNHDIIDDFYIDMDGKAESSKALPSWTMLFLVVIEIGVPVLFLAFMLGVTMMYHAIGVKIGIFPPIFVRNKKKKS